MADILEIVNEGDVLSKLEKIVEGIENVEAAVEKANAKALNVQVDLKGAESLTQLTNAMQEQKDAIQQLQNAQAAATQSSQQYNQATQSADASLKENISTLVQQRLELNKLNAELKEAERVIAKKSTTTEAERETVENLTQAQIDLKVAISQTTSLIKSQIKESQALQGSMDAMSQELGQLRERYRALSAAERENLQVGGALQKQIAELDEELKELDSTLGNNQRRVGNYSEALSGAGENAEVSGKKLTAFESIVNRMGLRMIAQFAVFGFIIDMLKQAGDAYTKFQQKFSEVTATLIGASKEMDNEFQTEAQSLAVLKARFEDAGATMEDKKEVVRELNREIKDQYGAINNVNDAEAFFRDKSADFIKALQIRAEAQANLNALTKEYQNEIEMQANPEKQLNVFNKIYAGIKATGQTLGGYFGRGPGQGDFEENYNFNKAVGAANQTNADVNDSRDRQDIYLKRALQLQRDAAALDVKGGFHTEKMDKERSANPEKTAKARMEAELRLIEQNRKKVDDELEKTYAESEKSYDDEYALLNKKANNEAQAYQKSLDILQKYSGKIGETQDQELARKATYVAKNDNLLTQSVVALNKVNEAIAEEYKKRDGYDKDYVAKLEATQKKLTELQETAKDKAVKNAALLKANAFSLFGDGGNKEAAINANYDVATKENQVRIDNADLSKAQNRADIANAAVAGDNATPLNAQTEAQRKQSEINRKEAEAANADLYKMQVKTAEDTAAETDAIEQRRIDKEKKDNDDRKAALNEIKDLSIQLAQESAQAIITITENQFAAQQQQLQIQAQKEAIAYEQKKNAIEATTNYQITKDNQLAVAAAQYAAQQNENQQKQNELALKKAKFEKEAQEAQAVMATAAAEAQALTFLTNPVTAPLYPAIAALIAATGAVQIAAIASTPLPQFFTGGVNTTPLFTAGERGRELIVTPSGDMTLTPDTTTVYNAPIGSRIYNNDDTEALIKYAMYGLTSGSSMSMERAQQMTDKGIIEAIKDGNADLIQAVRQNRPQRVNNDSRFYDELRASQYLQMRK